MKRFILGVFTAISLSVFAAALWPSGIYLETFQNGFLFGSGNTIDATGNHLQYSGKQHYGVKEWKASTTYYANEIVINDGKLYQAPAAPASFTSGVTFTIGNWNFIGSGAFETTASSEVENCNVTGSWSAVATYSAKCSRLGDKLFVEASVVLTGTPTGTFDFQFNDYSMNSSKITQPNTNAESSLLGFIKGFDIGVGGHDGSLVYTSPTTVRVIGDDGSSLWNATTPFTWASGDAINLNFWVPIAGWTDKVSVVNDTTLIEDHITSYTHVESRGNSGAVITTANNVDFTEVEDNTNSFDGTTFTTPADGVYEFQGSVGFTSVATRGVVLYLAGSQFRSVGYDSSGLAHNFSGTIKLTTGQQVQVRVTTNGGTLNNNSLYHWMTITKVR